MTWRAITMALGETDSAAQQLVRQRFAGGNTELLDRRALRRAPVPTLARLLARRYDDALLFAPDLRQPRLRLTGLLVGLPRARRRWLADQSGRIEPFAIGQHLRAHGAIILRHLAGCLLALGAAGPLLRLAYVYLALEERLRLRPFRWQRPRRLLYLRSQFWFGLRGGGSVAHTAGVIGGLEAAGVAVQVVSSDALTGISAPTSIVPPERWFDGRLKELEELAYNGAFLLAAQRAAWRMRPQAIYQRYTVFNFAGAVLSRLLRVPLVLEFNSSDVWKGRHWGEFHLLGLAERAERLQLRAADRVVVVSRVLRDELVATGVASGKIVVSPNGVDTHRFCPTVSGEPVRQRHGLLGRLVVGFSGTFGVWHGVPTLAAALPRVVSARPEVRFLLVGDGPLRHLVEEVIARDGLHDQVVLPGLVPHEQMPAYLAACDVLVSPHGRQADGREFFGSPTKLYEYMAAGRPIVASGIGQIGEVLRDGESALLVPPDDPEALAAAIIRLLDDPAQRERLARAARAQAERDHTWERNAERVVACLES